MDIHTYIDTNALYHNGEPRLNNETRSNFIFRSYRRMNANEKRFSSRIFPIFFFIKSKRHTADCDANKALC